MLFHYNIDEMPQDLNSYPYQLAYVKTESKSLYITLLRLHNLSLSEDLLYTNTDTQTHTHTQAFECL